MPAATISKQFGIGGAQLTGGFHGGDRDKANAYEGLQAIQSDIINLILVVSELIAADGGVTTGITVPTRLITVES